MVGSQSLGLILDQREERQTSPRSSRHVVEVQPTEFSLRAQELRVGVRLSWVSDRKAEIAMAMKHRAREDGVWRKLFSEVLVAAGIEGGGAFIGGVSTMSTDPAAVGVLREGVPSLQFVGCRNVQRFFSGVKLDGFFGGSLDHVLIEHRFGTVGKSTTVVLDAQSRRRKHVDHATISGFDVSQPIILG